MKRETEDLLEILYEASHLASRHGDRSGIPMALDLMLERLDRSLETDRELADELLANLDASRVVRAVGQTLLVATRFDQMLSTQRKRFSARFIETLKERGVDEEVIERMRSLS